MEVNSGAAVNQGLIGMQKSQTEMVRSAQQIAAAGASAASGKMQDIVEPLVNLKVQAQVFDSSARVVKSADDMIGTLLDVKA
jgi:flagellar hook protein FlgE